MTLEDLQKRYDYLADLTNWRECDELDEIFDAIPLLLNVARAAKDYTDPSIPTLSLEKYQALAEALEALEGGET